MTNHWFEGVRVRREKEPRALDNLVVGDTITLYIDTINFDSILTT